MGGPLRFGLTVLVLAAGAYLTCPDQPSLQQHFKARGKKYNIDKTQGVMRNRIKDRWAAWIGDEDVQAFDSYYVCSVARTRDTRLYVGVIGFWLQGLEVGHLVQVAQGEVVMTNGWERLKAEWRHTPVYDIYALVAVCCFVHLLWVIEGWRYGRVGGLFMRRHFTASLLNLSSLRLWTFVTCSVSHEETMHLLHNMLWLLAMGPELQVCIGREAVIVLYFWGGLCGGCCSMMMHAPGAEGLGASAAVYALEGFSVVLHPGRYYMWMGQEMASAQLLITRLVFDITSFSQGARIDFIAQIGGASIGWGYFEYLNRGLLLGTTPDFSWFTG